MDIDGQCHCGKVSFEADINPENVVICHCTDCQTFSSAPYRVSVIVASRKLKLRGEPNIYKKIGGSGQDVNVAFCGACGSALYSCKGDNPERYNLRLGIVRQRAMLPPQMQGFCEPALPWGMDVSAAPRAPEPARP